MLIVPATFQNDIVHGVSLSFIAVNFTVRSDEFIEKKKVGVGKWCRYFRPF